MSAEEIDDFLSGRWVARLGTIDPDGYPAVVPMWYYWDGRCLYFTTNPRRRAARNLRRDPRCFVVIDVDDRPLMGMRSNLAKAVTIKGDARLIDAETVGPDTVGVWFEAGPFCRPMPFHEASGCIVARYRLSERDGALGRLVRSAPPPDDPVAAANQRDESRRIIVKVAPRSIRAWDFSKAPFAAAPVAPPGRDDRAS
jgi:general stress protein 26